MTSQEQNLPWRGFSHPPRFVQSCYIKRFLCGSGQLSRSMRFPLSLCGYTTRYIQHSLGSALPSRYCADTCIHAPLSPRADEAIRLEDRYTRQSPTHSKAPLADVVRTDPTPSCPQRLRLIPCFLFRLCKRPYSRKQGPLRILIILSDSHICVAVVVRLIRVRIRTCGGRPCRCSRDGWTPPEAPSALPQMKKSFSLTWYPP